MEEKNFSKELQDVLSYMTDVLNKEFPSLMYTPEYLITAILDNKKCHAYLILNNCLMSSNLEELRRIYVNWLDTHAATRLFKPKSQIIRFNPELDNVIKYAESEATILNAPNVGTEHALLAMLHPTNGIEKVIEVFKNIGVDYNFIFSKCTEKKQDNKPNKVNKKMNPMFPLKGEINTKAITSKTNYIDQYTTNLNKLAREGKIDELVGRTTELNQIVKILARRKKNNAILVGTGGCGKSQIVYGIADMIVKGQVPEILRDKEIVMMNIMALVSGTHFRGMFEERVNGLFDELKNSNRHILFIDDIQNVLKSTSKDKDTDISGMIGNILAEGDVRVIATANFKDYRNSVEINTSIARKLQKIVIEPTSVEETIEILRNNKKYYEAYHNVSYSDEVLVKTTELAHRFISDRSLPDSAIDLIDLAGAYTCLIDREPIEVSNARHKLFELDKIKANFLNSGDFEEIEKLEKEENDLKLIIAKFNREKEEKPSEYCLPITIDHITEAVADVTGIPMQKLTTDEKSRIANINEKLKEHIVGQDEAIDSICQVIKRNKVGLGDKQKPTGVFLLAGESGCGKTLLAKKLAEEIYGSEKELVRIDMSEYSEKSSVAKLIGAAPGYIGFENGGQLTEAIKNKQHCVLLLDEIEKADPEVYNIFLPLFDDGRLTDNAGQTINFKNVIIIMTSNVGVKKATEMGDGVGFVINSEANFQSIIDKQLKKTFAPEFLNRLNKVVYFNSLTDDNMKNIVKLELKKFTKRINEIHCDLTYTDSVVNFIHDLARQEKGMGARPVGRLIQTHIEDNITDLLLQNDYNNYTFKVDIENDKVIVR